MAADEAETPPPNIRSRMDQMTSGICEWNKEPGDDSERITIGERSINRDLDEDESERILKHIDSESNKMTTIRGSADTRKSKKGKKKKKKVKLVSHERDVNA